MLRHVALVRTDVSEELSASFIRVTSIGELRTTLAVTSNRRTLRRNVTSQKAPLFRHPIDCQPPSLRALTKSFRHDSASFWGCHITHGPSFMRGRGRLIQRCGLDWPGHVPVWKVACGYSCSGTPSSGLLQSRCWCTVDVSCAQLCRVYSCVVCRPVSCVDLCRVYSCVVCRPVSCVQLCHV
jgi:hypothetical protein